MEGSHNFIIDKKFNVILKKSTFDQLRVILSLFTVTVYGQKIQNLVNCSKTIDKSVRMLVWAPLN